MNFDQSQLILGQLTVPSGSVCLLYSVGVSSGGIYHQLAKDEEPKMFFGDNPDSLQTLRLIIYRELLTHSNGRLVLLLKLPTAGRELVGGGRALSVSELVDLSWLSLPNVFQPLWQIPGIQQILTRKPDRLLVGTCQVVEKTEQVKVLIDTTGRAAGLIASLGDRPRSPGR